MSNAICRQNLDFAGYYMWMAVKMYTLVGSMFFSTRLTLMGPLFCIYLVPCSVNLWVPCRGIVMSRKGGENKRTSLDVVALLCLSFC